MQLTFLLRSLSRVDDGEWHTIKIRRRKRVGFISVDDSPPVRGIAIGGTITLRTNSKLWIGKASAHFVCILCQRLIPRLLNFVDGIGYPLFPSVVLLSINSNVNVLLYVFFKICFQLINRCIPGGMPSLPPGLPQAYYKGFEGCIRQVTVNARTLDLLVKSDTNVISYCHDNEI